MSTPQYLRKATIAVGPAGGQGLDFSTFRCVFQIRRGDVQTPNECDVKIYNLADNTANQLATKEFDTISIQAGYEGNFGLLFTGTIKQVRQGREDQKNTYVAITAADGDHAYNFSTTALSLAAGGTSPANKIETLIRGMAAKGAGLGRLPKLSTNAAVRGQVFFGDTRDLLRDFAKQNDCTWSIQDGNVTLIPLTSYLPGPPVVITSENGLIGIPEQTQQGIQMRLLLNPTIKIGQLVKLDNKSVVNRIRLGLDASSLSSNPKLLQYIKTNADGLYYVMVANHYGDTRGTPWYTDLTCLAVDASVPDYYDKQAAVSPAVGPIPRY